MGSPKPALGYPSRTAAVLALRADSVPTTEIAERLGIEAKTVAALENSAARSRALAAEGNRTILFPPELIEALMPHAARRGISANALARRLIETVVESELVDAVLDDCVTVGIGNDAIGDAR
jgi:hypothetical protein